MAILIKHHLPVFKALRKAELPVAEETSKALADLEAMMDEREETTKP